MPVYEYRCAKGHTYEKTEGFSAPPVQRCAHCSARARRQISMPAVIFKGSGFYSTDNRGSGPPSSGGAGTASDNGHSHGETSSAGEDGAKIETPASE